MKKTNYLVIILVLALALFVGSYMMVIGMILFKIMIGLVGLGIFAAGFYIGRVTKRVKK